MKTFEYKTIEISFKGNWFPKMDSEEIQKKLNAEGMQGWELVSTLPKLSGMHPRAFLLIFKRQK